jgi:hypothetical protein
MKHLFKSLAAFQQEVPVIHKATQGYGYSYADLTSIFTVINPLLKKHGLGFSQPLQCQDGVTYLETIIYHVESGETLTSKVEIPRIALAKMNDYQSFGSGITYFRRYSLAAALNLVTDVDTDAAGEQIRPGKEQVQDKITLSTPQFNALVGAIQVGTLNKEGEPYTVAFAEKHYKLTKEQLQTLKSI